MLKEKFIKCFTDATTVILCPVYNAGENINLKFKYENFAKQIIKKSKTRIIMVNDEKDLLKYIKQNIFGNKIVIGMGAGSISNWMKFLASELA